jgi:hypothetical protein
MSYAAKINALGDGVIRALERSRVSITDISFGGAIEPPARIIAPSFADSKFQAEQALGDWAEDCLRAGIEKALAPELTAFHYGFNSKTIAGEVGFKEEYTAGIRDTCQWGKRADLLVGDPALHETVDLTQIPTGETRDIVSKSLGAIEVRSSRTEALIYMEYQKKRAENGIRVDNLVPNFTVKIEDLMKVYRWIEVFDRPQLYAQVFFDVVYGINVSDIMKHISESTRLRIEEPQRSRKATIFLPITHGVQIGRVAVRPQFEVVDRLTANGRHDIYAKPSGGEIVVDGAALKQLMLDA